jgi:hypothetical protein
MRGQGFGGQVLRESIAPTSQRNWCMLASIQRWCLFCEINQGSCKVGVIGDDVAVEIAESEE